MQVVETVHSRILPGPLVHLFGIGGIPTSGLSRYTVYSHCSGKGACLEVFHQEVVYLLCFGSQRIYRCGIESGCAERQAYFGCWHLVGTCYQSGRNGKRVSSSTVGAVCHDGQCIAYSDDIGTYYRSIIRYADLAGIFRSEIDVLVVLQGDGDIACFYGASCFRGCRNDIGASTWAMSCSTSVSQAANKKTAAAKVYNICSFFIIVIS